MVRKLSRGMKDIMVMSFMRQIEYMEKEIKTRKQDSYVSACDVLMLYRVIEAIDEVFEISDDVIGNNRKSLLQKLSDLSLLVNQKEMEKYKKEYGISF